MDADVQSLSFRVKFVLFFSSVYTKRTSPINTTILSPHVHMMGDEAACICYVRLQQFITRSVRRLPLQRERVYFLQVHVSRAVLNGMSASVLHFVLCIDFLSSFVPLFLPVEGEVKHP